MLDLTDDRLLKLTDDAKRNLFAVRHHPGYESVFDVMEQLCQLSETELLKMDRSVAGITGEQVLSAQEQCRAQRCFMERVQFQIEAQVKAILEAQRARQADAALAEDPEGADAT
jgi:hypothetical protein